jgi:hypothetical protein
MLGSEKAVTTMRRSLRSRRVNLENSNFWYIDEVFGFLEKNPDAEAVLISELGIKQNHTDFTDALEELRNAYSNIRIVFIMENPERDYDFECWCHDRNIYDIFYPNRHTDIDIDAIGKVICLGRIDPAYSPPPPQPEPVEPPSPPKRTWGPASRWPEVRLPNLSEFRKRKADKPEPDEPDAYIPEQDSDIKVIGIINSSRGLGATTLTVEMAECLLNAGYSVAVMAMDLKADLLVSGLAEEGVTVSVPIGGEMDCWEALAEAHDYLIIDFGIIFDFLPSGKPTLAAQRADEALAVREAREFCDIRLYLTSDEPWHRNKEDPFTGEEKGCTVNVREADASNILRLLGVI